MKEVREAQEAPTPALTQRGREIAPAPVGFAPELVSPSTLAFLQMTAGNSAVTELVVQRQAIDAPPAPAAAPAAHPAAHGRPTLQRGDRGQAVEGLQLKLNVIPAAGGPAELNVNGIFDAATDTAVRNFQTANGIGVDGIVGSTTWPAILAAAAAAEAAPLPAHPVLHLNATGTAVGEAQEKLNAAGAAVPALLVVTGVFDGSMQTAVNRFQTTTMRKAAGNSTVDAPTWTALDAAAPGGGSRPGRGGLLAMIESHVEAPGGGRPLAPTTGATSLHDIVGPGGLQRGPAVEELQQKLNHWMRSQAITPLLAEDGGWGIHTQQAILQFQTAQGLVPQTGIGDLPTWQRLDVVSPTSTAGYEKREWTENVGGHTYSMVAGSASHYSWQLGHRHMTVTAKINFTGVPAPAATWFGYIQNTWNRFKAVKHGGGDHVAIDFNPVQGGGGDSHTVQVLNPPVAHPPAPPPPRPRSDAGHFYLGDPDMPQTISHEFGHLVGLRDEYQLHGGDYVSETGHEAFVGQAAAPGGLTAAGVAAALQTAMVNRNTQAAFNASYGAGIRQGAFAQQVVQAYSALAHGVVPAVAPAPGVAGQPAIPLTGDLVNDMDRALPNIAATPLTKYQPIEAFTYTSGSIMGAAGWNPDPHDHGAQARHVREFVDIVQTVRGGTWEAAHR